ncbi:MAG: hypothetical protein Q8N04_13850 [Nitrospira sp.]|nr:hypothetical protein [Nitrospira sp.]
MLTRFCALLLCCGILAACNRSDESGSKSAADWAKAGETDGYVYFADHASIKQADEIVTMSDLFDYKVARTEGGGAPALSKKTDRGYDCQNQKSQPLKTTWYSGQMGTGSVVRSSGDSDQLTPVMAGSPTAALIKIACRAH